MEYILGLMAGTIMECGKKIKCLVLAVLTGKMEENIQVNISQIIKKGKEYIFGQMAKNISVIGEKENKMVWECKLIIKGLVKFMNGKMEKK